MPPLKKCLQARAANLESWKALKRLGKRLSPKKKKRIRTDCDLSRDLENIPPLDTGIVSSINSTRESPKLTEDPFIVLPNPTDSVLGEPHWNLGRDYSPEPFQMTFNTKFSLAPLIERDINASPTRQSHAKGTHTMCMPTRRARFMECDSSDSESQGENDSDLEFEGYQNGPGKIRESPTMETAIEAAKIISKIITGEEKGKGGGYKDPKHDPFTRRRLEGIYGLLNHYTSKLSMTRGHWRQSSLNAAITFGHGVYCSRQLRRLARAFIDDHSVLPLNPYGGWKQSMLTDEGICQKLTLYLQSLGKNITAQKLCDFINNQQFRDKFGLERQITTKTAQRYLRFLGYRFGYPEKGLYADGHEREDIVEYRNQIYLPTLLALEKQIQTYSHDGLPDLNPIEIGLQVIIWFHDESVFYAHDRRRRFWIHKDEKPTPYQKGEGSSLMIADFVSADLGWLRSPDGTESARRVFKPGKNKDGYFSTDNIEEQVQQAMDILSKHYPGFKHIFIYDNATTHLKRADGSLSASKMPMGPSNKFFLKVAARNDLGRKIFLPNGEVKKVKIRMMDGEFNGQKQSLYFESGHQREGQFKGMKIILEERGIATQGLKAQCSRFKCVNPDSDCCMRRILYNQPDFACVPSLLETACSSRGFKVIFLPKFHCELNFIEQCWGRAKALYRLNPDSSREDVLAKNVIQALEGVTLTQMRRYANRSWRFVHAYAEGLSGAQAVWAAKKYKGHRTLPPSLKNDLQLANMS